MPQSRVFLLVPAAALTLAVPLALPRAGQTRPPRPSPQTYRWLLPAQHAGVDVVELHPNDCYVVERAAGAVYFGDPPAGVQELQRQLPVPIAHLVDEPGDHPECVTDTCRRDEAVADAIARRLTEAGDARLLRAVDHRPTPLDSSFGGAYTDVGSEERTPFRNGREQRMIYLHLGTAGRSNCYEAKAPRLLSIHIRDFDGHPNRTGVYRGYLYIEHHHPALAGDTVAWQESHQAAPRTHPIGSLVPRLVWPIRAPIGD